MINQGNGWFLEESSLRIPADWTMSADVEFLDVDQDGDSDLMVANAGANSVSLFVGDGAGNFTDGGSFPTPWAPHWVNMEDFDRDGHNDLAVASYGSRHVSILKGKGDGTFVSTPFVFLLFTKTNNCLSVL